MVEKTDRLVLEEILNEKQIHHILNKSIGENVKWEYKGSEVRPAMDGLGGFLGDHMKAVLNVDIGEEIKKVYVFLKRIPVDNKPKADFIDSKKYFKREKLMFQVLEQICEDGPNPWSAKAYIYTDNMIVMPDLSLQEYKTQHYLHTLDLAHIFVAVKSIARFHAAFVNYETKKSIDLNRTYNINQVFSDIITEPAFCDSPWLKAASKVSTKLLKQFSTKSYHNLPDLEYKLTKLYVEACDSVLEYKDTVNVLIHKDLWVNNIMFKYDHDVPVNAVLIDYQCIRYAPPAFDLMLFIYFTTDRKFRKDNEKKIFDHYYSVFNESLNEESKERLTRLGYDKENFLLWCEKARMFGMLVPICICPFSLLDSKTAQKTFDDPDTFDKHFLEDRSGPVVAHAMKCSIYRDRNVEITEEFVERYLL